jgi:hypothetical protein
MCIRDWIISYYVIPELIDNIVWYFMALIFILLGIAQFITWVMGSDKILKKKNFYISFFNSLCLTAYCQKYISAHSEGFNYLFLCILAFLGILCISWLVNWALFPVLKKVLSWFNAIIPWVQKTKGGKNVMLFFSLVKKGKSAIARRNRRWSKTCSDAFQYNAYFKMCLYAV